MAKTPIETAHAQMINEDITELKDWQNKVYATYFKTLTADEHAAIGRNVQQIINLLKQKAK